MQCRPIVDPSTVNVRAMLEQRRQYVVSIIPVGELGSFAQPMVHDIDQRGKSVVESVEVRISSRVQELADRLERCPPESNREHRRHGVRVDAVGPVEWIAQSALRRRDVARTERTFARDARFHRRRITTRIDPRCHRSPFLPLSFPPS
jgi:hypothetical protein